MEESAGAARRVASNALNPFAAQVFTRLLMLGYAVVQYRVLGARADGVLGSYFLAALVLMYASTASEWGLGTLLTRELARRPRGEAAGQVQQLFAQTLALRLAISLGLFIPVGLFILLYTTLFSWGEGGAWALLILTLSLLPGAFSGTVTAVLYAYERMTLPALVGIGTSALNVALGLGALLLGWGVIGLAVAALLATCATAAVFWWILRRELPEAARGLSLRGLRIERRTATGLLAAGWPLLLNALLIGLFFRVDQFIVQPVLGDFAVERYNAAYSYLNFVLLITPAVTLALFPRMSRHAQDDIPRMSREYGFALKLLVSLSGLIVAMTVWFAPLLVTVVTGGKEGYLPESAVALQILILFLPFSFVNGVTQYVLIALDRQKLITWAFALTLVFNVAANLALVPVLGIYGAAIVTVLSELVLLVPFVMWVRRELASVGGGPGIGLAWKPLVAGSVTGGAMYALWALFEGWDRDLGSLVTYAGAGALLAAVYVGVLVVLRPFTQEEARTLARAVRKTP
jgi:O-antigen/teichoic acid export membrane protein